MRVTIGCLFIKVGMAIVPKDTRELVRKTLMYHVPGALSADEKADVRRMLSEYRAAT